MVPSGSGKGGMPSFGPVGGVNLLESKSTSQMSSGSLKCKIQTQNYKQE